MILNLTTPGIVGMELIRHVKITYPDIQVIALSRHYSIQNRVKAFVACAYELFETPVDINHLNNTIIKAYKKG